MTAAYDTYDYPAYWEDRKYEHESEVIAIKAFLQKIAKIKRIAEIGSGYGRLTPYYIYRAKTVDLIDPSSKLLKISKNKFKSYKNINFLESEISQLPKKLKNRKFDLIIMVRVLHHIKDLDKCFAIIKKLLDKSGYLILEFANKVHWKALFLNFIKGNFVFPIDIFPKDLRSKGKKYNKYLPFRNYHPGILKDTLEEYGFEVTDTRSVSNVRSSLIKKYIPLPILLSLERKLQKLLSGIYFGPSIFLLVRKTG